MLPIYLTHSWDYGDAYGLLACQLARHLERQGVTVAPFARGDTWRSNQPADVQAITSRSAVVAWPEGGIVVGIPHHFADLHPAAQTGKRIAVTMWESSKLPSDWPDVLNAFDAVVVPSTFCAEVLAASGVSVPIHVVPLGIGELYQRVERLEPQPLTFLAFLDRGGRKGGLIAWQAFLRAFGDDPEKHLILKWRQSPRPLNILNPNVTLLAGDLDELGMALLYARCHVLLAPSCGEGFGLLPREFAATGGIVFATHWSGLADDLDQWGWRLAYTMQPCRYEGDRWQGMDLGEWAQPDIEDIVTSLHAVDIFYQSMSASAQRQAKEVRKRYRWESFAARVFEIWEAL